jgi:hypothetical protein
LLRQELDAPGSAISLLNGKSLVTIPEALPQGILVLRESGASLRPIVLEARG